MGRGEEGVATAGRSGAKALRRSRDYLRGAMVSTSTFEAAGLLSPAILRTLDAIHIASALELGDDLQGVVTYDERLAGTARKNGAFVVSPVRT